MAAHADRGDCLANDGELFDDFRTKISRSHEGEELVAQHVTNGEASVGCDSWRGQGRFELLFGFPWAAQSAFKI